MIWLRFVDPDCLDIPRHGDTNDTDPVADRQHRCECVRCGAFALMLADPEDALGEADGP